MKFRILLLAAIAQTILFFGHWFVYETWTSFWRSPDPPGISGLQIALFVLSLSYVAASLLAFRSDHVAVRLFYSISSVWLGFLNFLFLAAWLCWLVYLLGRVSGHPLAQPAIVAVLYGLAVAFTVYGVLNALWIRTQTITVKLPGLPESWRGRRAVLVSDTHLGHVNGAGFTRRVVRMIQKLRPDIVFLAGDLFDGTKVDADAAAEPWKEISPPYGKYFVTGNHEEFSNPIAFMTALRRVGVQVLNNEMTTADGLQILGVHYHDSIRADRLQSILKGMGLERERASVLLSHAPNSLEVSERAGISLQLSGHTHGGQVFPLTWVTRRIFKQYTHGLHRFGKLQVYTSYGAGTWGPPMRVGTHPEIVLIHFE